MLEDYCGCMKMQPCRSAAGSAVETVTKDGTSQTESMGGMYTKLVGPSCDGVEDYVHSPVGIKGLYLIFRKRRFSLVHVDLLPRSFIVVRGKREVYRSAAAGLESD